MLDVALSTLYLPRCAACDARVGSGQPLCPPCSESLEALEVACPRCAEPLAGRVAVTCARCLRHPPPYEAIVAPWRYGGELATALRRLKLGRQPALARELAPLIAPFLAAAIDAARPDLVVPVPLHWRRLLGRGFNHAQLLAEEALRPLAAPPLDTLSLRRIWPAPSQTTLGAAERAATVRGAFEVAARRRRKIAGRRVLVIDDIATTGATLAAVSRALHDAGATGVVGFVVARAGG